MSKQKIAKKSWTKFTIISLQKQLKNMVRNYLKILLGERKMSQPAHDKKSNNSCLIAILILIGIAMFYGVWLLYIGTFLVWLCYKRIPDKKIKTISTIIIVIVFLILESIWLNKIMSGNKTEEPTQQITQNTQDQENTEEEKQKATIELQKTDFMTMYNKINTEVYNSRKISYFANNIITEVSSSYAYNLFKDDEEMQRKCSLYFTYSSFAIPDSLKGYKEDIEQSLSELSNACSILQTSSRNMAEYINTKNLKYSRNSSEALKQEPFKLMSNAISRLIYGVGEKIGIDTEKLKLEYENMSNQIIQEYDELLKSKGR